jgi:hypothetical protein
MKKLLFIAVISIGLMSFAAYTSTTMHIVTPQGVAKTADTLVGAGAANSDTGITFINVTEKRDLAFELTVTTLSGTIASTSNILYGYNNNGAKLTAAQAAALVVAGTAKAITGNTTYCAGCVGASSTTVPGATLKYTWQVPSSSGALYDNFFIAAKQTGTFTATYSAKAISEI